MWRLNSWLRYGSRPTLALEVIPSPFHARALSLSLLQRLTVHDRKRLGLGDTDDEVGDFTTTNARSKSRKGREGVITTYWVWESAAVWRMMEDERKRARTATSAEGDAGDEGATVPMSDADGEAEAEWEELGTDCVPPACVRMTEVLRAKLNELVNSDAVKNEALRSAIRSATESQTAVNVSANV